MPVVRAIDGKVSFKCPGCKMVHSLPVEGAARPRWNFNGDTEKPTLTPSILAKSGHYVDGDRAGHDCWCSYEERFGEESSFACGVCHSFVTDGNIRFLDDCTHALAGQTVPLPQLGAEDQG